MSNLFSRIVNYEISDSQRNILNLLGGGGFFHIHHDHDYEQVFATANLIAQKNYPDSDDENIKRVQGILSGLQEGTEIVVSSSGNRLCIAMYWDEGSDCEYVDCLAVRYGNAIPKSAELLPAFSVAMALADIAVDTIKGITDGVNKEMGDVFNIEN